MTTKYSTFWGLSYTTRVTIALMELSCVCINSHTCMLCALMSPYPTEVMVQTPSRVK